MKKVHAAEFFLGEDDYISTTPDLRAANIIQIMLSNLPQKRTMYECTVQPPGLGVGGDFREKGRPTQLARPAQPCRATQPGRAKTACPGHSAGLGHTV